jgi:hypothetical protein
MTAILTYADGTQSSAQIDNALNIIEVQRWYLTEKDCGFLRTHKIAPFACTPDERLAVPTNHKFELREVSNGYPYYIELA